VHYAVDVVVSVRVHNRANSQDAACPAKVRMRRVCAGYDMRKQAGRRVFGKEEDAARVLRYTKGKQAGGRRPRVRLGGACGESVRVHYEHPVRTPRVQPGRSKRRVGTGTLVHYEQTVRPCLVLRAVLQLAHVLVLKDGEDLLPGSDTHSLTVYSWCTNAVLTLASPLASWIFSCRVPVCPYTLVTCSSLTWPLVPRLFAHSVPLHP
jgi:hypothetical protein